MTIRVFRHMVGFSAAWVVLSVVVNGCVCVVHHQHGDHSRPVYVPSPPPAPKEESQSAAPSAEHVWIAGHWDWNEVDEMWEWQDGIWAIPPQPGFRWQAPRYDDHGDNTWVYLPGRWQRAEETADSRLHEEGMPGTQSAGAPHTPDKNVKPPPDAAAKSETSDTATPEQSHNPPPPPTDDAQEGKPAPETGGTEGEKPGKTEPAVTPPEQTEKEKLAPEKPKPDKPKPGKPKPGKPKPEQAMPEKPKVEKPKPGAASPNQDNEQPEKSKPGREPAKKSESEKTGSQ